MFTVVRSTKFVRPLGNAKKQVKRSLANKSKAMVDMDSNSDGKMRAASAPEGLFNSQMEVVDCDQNYFITSRLAYSHLPCYSFRTRKQKLTMRKVRPELSL
ncbi:unnamed protein product [Brugia timori]|uniref:60S ribosomal protein L6 n=1 Tax=Brugia timori TaxID=42155 RepID=A0A0R3Q819_9BILA|nr:unnamed protein product [Brugia timori]